KAPVPRLISNALNVPSLPSPTRSVSFVEYKRVPVELMARQLGLVPISTTPEGVIAPDARSTVDIWLPRPLPGGKSTWVGSVSLSGELKVPTNAIKAPAFRD